MRYRNVAMVSIFFILSLIINPTHVQGVDISKYQFSSSNYDISINLEYKKTKTGDTVQFSSIVKYKGSIQSPKLIIAMNIINLQDGSPVDPEDWSPQRTQFISSMQTNNQVTKFLTVYTILKGDYMVYLVVIPIPENSDVATVPVSSSAIHLSVQHFTRLNPGGILPIAIGVPVILIIGYYLVLKFRRGKIDLY